MHKAQAQMYKAHTQVLRVQVQVCFHIDHLIHAGFHVDHVIICSQRAQL